MVIKHTVHTFSSKVEATDLDEGPNAEISYSIEFGNDDGFFTINENDGAITLDKTIPLVDNRILQFSLYVTAKDGKLSFNGDIPGCGYFPVDLKTTALPFHTFRRRYKQIDFCNGGCQGTRRFSSSVPSEDLPGESRGGSVRRRHCQGPYSTKSFLIRSSIPSDCPCN